MEEGENARLQTSNSKRQMEEGGNAKLQTSNSKRQMEEGENARTGSPPWLPCSPEWQREKNSGKI